MSRPVVYVSVAVSLDGFMDDNSDERLLLSNDADFDAVDQLRAEVDAIVVGAGTVRADNPRLLVRSASRKVERVAAGRSPSPTRVVFSGSGVVPKNARLWESDTAVLVATSADGAGNVPLTGRVSEQNLPLDAVTPLEIMVVDGPQALLQGLYERGMRRVLVEGGAAVLAEFFAAGFVDHLRMAIAPVVLGQNGGPQFLDPTIRTELSTGSSRFGLHLHNVEQLDDIAVLHYG